MENLRRLVGWMEDEWLRFLLWFLFGLIFLPVLASQLTSWINLDRLYLGLTPDQFDASTLLLVLSPYLVYSFYRLVHAFKVCGRERQFYEEHHG